MLSQVLFNAFLKTLEEPPRHALFILATTEKHKILPTILSRCQIYHLQSYQCDGYGGAFGKCSEEEHIEVEPEALNTLPKKQTGDT